MRTEKLARLWYCKPNHQAEFPLVDFDHVPWNGMRIPQTWFLGGLDHQGALRFPHAFSPDSKGDRSQHALRFPGMDCCAGVCLNGIYLGHHGGSVFETFPIMRLERGGNSFPFGCATRRMDC